MEPKFCIHGTIRLKHLRVPTRCPNSSSRTAQKLIIKKRLVNKKQAQGKTLVMGEDLQPARWKSCQVAGKSLGAPLIRLLFFYLPTFPQFIPPKFARTLRAKINQITHLEDSNGHLWKVKFSKLEGSLVFQQGWGEFEEDHSIKFGYLLVFKYVTGLHFLVQIFSTSACEETNFSRNDNANHAPMKKSDIGPNPRGESSQSKNLFGTMIEHGEIKKGNLSMSDIVLIERPLTIEEKSSCLVNGSKPIKESSHSNKVFETMTEQNEIGKGNRKTSGPCCH